MQLFKNILVYQPADQGVTASLRIAARLSHQRARVTVVDVFEQQGVRSKSIFGDASEPPEFDRRERQEWLNELLNDVDVDADVQVKSLTGRPIDALVIEMLAGSHDLLLKDAESESENLFFGSLDLRLLRLAPTAVWIADPNAPAKPRRILAAIDPQADDEVMRMNERVIRLASLLASQEGAELFIVSAWSASVAGFEQEGEESEKCLRRKKRVGGRAWESLEHVIKTSQLRIPADNVIFEAGLAADTIADAVVHVQPDLLVMGSVKRRGIPGLWIGNTTEEVTRQVECSVLTIKPEDFKFLLPQQRSP